MSAYLLGAILNMAIAFSTVFRTRLMPIGRKSFEDILDRVVETRSRTQIIAESLRIPSFAVVWPIAFAKGSIVQTGTTYNQLVAKIQLRPIGVHIAAGNLIFLCVIVTFRWLDLIWQPLYGILLALSLVGIVGRHISYLARPLVVELCRSLRAPAIPLAAIAILDGAALSIAFAAINAYSAPAGPSLATLSDAAVSIFDVPSNLTGLAGKNASEMAAAFAGFLYSTVLLQSVLGTKDFRRTAEDYRQIALLLVNAGDYDLALEWLRKEEDSAPLSFWLRARINLAKGRPEAALSNLREAQSRSGENTDVHMLALELIYCMNITILSFDLRLKMCYYLISQHYPDFTLAAVIRTQMILFNEEELGDDNPNISKLLSLCSEDEYPITRSHLLALDGNYVDALAVLKRAQPSSAEERVYSMVRQCQLVVGDPEMTVETKGNYLCIWREQSLPIVIGLCSDLRESDRAILFGELLALKHLIMNFTQDQTDADQTALTAGALTQLDDLIHRLAPSQEMVQKLENGFQDVARVRGW